MVKIAQVLGKIFTGFAGRTARHGVLAAQAFAAGPDGWVRPEDWDWRLELEAGLGDWARRRLFRRLDPETGYISVLCFLI
jgi:hypothetical protein